MTARILDGRAVAAQLRREIAADTKQLRAATGIVPGISIVLAGENPASVTYTRNKSKASRDVGMHGDLVRLEENVSQKRLIETVHRLNGDAAVHGILVQMPLPPHIDSEPVLEAIDPDKDVDGFHPVNGGRLLSGLEGFVPCTPAGIIELLRRHEIPLEGREAVVIGRSTIVGRPLALLLLRENATVTVCHSRTRDLEAVASRADVLVCAIGRKAFVRAGHIRPGAVVVDVGINKCESEEEAVGLFGGDSKRVERVRDKGFTLVGDVHPAEAMERAGWFTPVPGGVGPMTIAMLLRNTLVAARRQAGGDDGTAP